MNILFYKKKHALEKRLVKEVRIKHTLLGFKHARHEHT